jgi:hypothetical protein
VRGATGPVTCTPSCWRSRDAAGRGVRRGSAASITFSAFSSPDLAIITLRRARPPRGSRERKVASYVETIVGPGEQVVHVGRVSLWSIASSLIGGVLLILIGIGLAIAHPLGAVVSALGVLVIVVALVRRASTELAVTTHRVIAKFGFISRRTIEINLSKIESVRVEQSVAGRIFNYGSIIVTGTGSTMDPIPFIADPIRFRQAIQSATDTVQRT